MGHYGPHPALRLAKDPSDPVWHWFICNGPHGERFSWAKNSVAPRDIEYLKMFIQEKTGADPAFNERARKVALEALEIDDVVMIRTGIQVLAVVGLDEDLEIIKQFVQHADSNVVNDAKCCLFERGYKEKNRLAE